MGSREPIIASGCVWLRPDPTPPAPGAVHATADDVHLVEGPVKAHA